MIIKKIRVSFCAQVLVLALPVCLNSALADDVSSEKNHSWYIGGGLGITEIDPDTGDTSYSVSDKSDAGFKLFAGYDFTKRFTVEGFYTDLGSSTLNSDFISKPEGKINYKTFGASALWYFWRNGEDAGDNPRKGWQAYVHGGLSFLNNSATNIDYEQSNSTQFQYGAAIEYGLNNGIALRAGLDLYDKDAGMVFVGILKRFGTMSKRKAVVKPEPEKVIIVAEPEPVVEPAPVATQKVIVPAVTIAYDIDTDKDGVYDRLDECADSSSAFSVDETGCSIIELKFGGVNFEPQSFELTPQSKEMLDEVVVTINASPELQKIEVSAHTDNKGSEKYNLKLSEQRAETVKQYLIEKGVRENRLVAKGYGESEPIADNKTDEGRAKNRRVELTVIEDEVPAEKVE